MPKKILAVDDDEVLLQLIKSRLKANGYQMFTASSGEEALKSAEENHPDLIIMDVMMPGIDGLQTARRIKKNPLTASIPIIMLTAVTQADVINVALESGACDYIAKPFQVSVLLEKVKKVLAHAAG